MPPRRPILRPAKLSGEYGSYSILMDGAGEPRLLGKGGFGRTYLAQHHLLETLAALKVIDERYAQEPETRERFLREGRALARLNHPHIARLLDFGEIEGVLYYAMEFCAGGDLSRYCRQHGPLGPEVWLPIARQLASALDRCHTAGFIHRDLKPSNVMLVQEAGPPVVKLIDFGLVHAEILTEEERLLMGTPLYASPEQLSTGEVDARSDLFSLGMSLWHLALGGPPESGKAAQVIARRCSPASLEPDLPRNLPGALRQFLASLVEKHRERRPASAAVVVALLDGLLNEYGPDANLEAKGERGRPGAGPLRETELAQGEGELFPLRTLGRTLSFEYEVADFVAASDSGAYQSARTILGGEAVWLHLLEAKLVGDELLLRKVRMAAAGWRRASLPHFLQPLAMCACQADVVVVLRAPTGVPLAAALGQRRADLGVALLSLLRLIARAADAALELGLPGPEFDETCVYVPPDFPGEAAHWSFDLVPRWLLSGEAVAGEKGPCPDLSTAETVAAGPRQLPQGTAVPTVEFARLVRRLTMGRDRAIPGGEPGRPSPFGRWLDHVIAENIQPVSCAALLEELYQRGLCSQTDEPATPRIEPGTVERKPARVSSPSPPLVRRLVHALALRRRALFLLAIAAGCVWLVGQQYVRTMESSVQPTPSSLRIIPAGAVLRLLGDFPPGSSFSVGGLPRPAEIHGREALVSISEGGPLPSDVVVSAPGYQRTGYLIEKTADLTVAHELQFLRTHGSLVLTRKGLCDYSQAAAILYEVPDSSGMATTAASPLLINFPAAPGEPFRWEIPTGRYNLFLRAGSARIQPIFFQNVTVKEGLDQICALPPSYAGTFRGVLPLARVSGEVAPPPGAGAVTMQLRPGLTEGTLTAGSPVALDDLLLGGAGELTAMARFGASSATPAFDQRMIGHLSVSGTDLEVTFTEVSSDRKRPPERPARSPYAAAKWMRRGILHRE